MQKLNARHALALVGALVGALAVTSAGAQTAPAARPAVGSRTGQQAWSAVCANCHMPRRPGARPTGPARGGDEIRGRCPKRRRSCPS